MQIQEGHVLTVEQIAEPAVVVPTLLVSDCHWLVDNGTQGLPRPITTISCLCLTLGFGPDVTCFTDPMSPITPAEGLGDGISPITSPPATPGAPTAEHDPTTSGIATISSMSSHLARRSRTLSQSRFLREDYGRSSTPDYDEVSYYLSCSSIPYYSLT